MERAHESVHVAIILNGFLKDVSMEKQRIYCSGPLFCAEEVGGMTAIAAILEKSGFHTFLPHRDGLEAYVLRFPNASFPSTFSPIRRQVDEAIFCLDVYELVEGCSAMVCNLNGRVPDEGMIVEAALAYAAGKPLVMYKNDLRAPFGGYDNSMLTSLCKGKIVCQLAEIPVALKDELLRKIPVAALSDDLEKSVGRGRRIRSILDKLPEKRFKKTWTEEVLAQVLTESFDR
jgi:nucleoside 2-deoxyribosyltransferase